MEIGLVKIINKKNGYGFLKNAADKDIFFHFNDFKDDHLLIKQSLPITYTLNYSKKRNKTAAINCRFLKTYEDYAAVMKLNEKETIVLKIENQDVAKQNKKYSNIEYKLKYYCFRHIFTNNSAEVFKSYVYNYFVENQSDLSYIQYVHFIFKRIINILPSSDERRTLITELFSQFQSIVDDEIRFDLWRSRNYRLLGYNSVDELFVSDDVIAKFSHKITLNNLKIISEYSNMEQLCNAVVLKHINSKEKKSLEYLLQLYQFAEYLLPEEKDEILELLDNELYNTVIDDVKESVSTFGVLNSEYQLVWFDKIRKSIPLELSLQNTKKINEFIDELLVQSLSPTLTIELFIAGKQNSISRVSEADIVQFLKRNYYEVRYNLLRKIPDADTQLRILKLFERETNILETYKILEGAILIDNPHLDYREIIYKKFDSDAIGPIAHKTLMENYLEHVNSETDEDIRFKLFFSGLIKAISTEEILCRIPDISVDKFSFIINCPFYNLEFKKTLLLRLIDKPKISSYELETLLRTSKEYFNPQIYTDIYKEVKIDIDLRTDFNMWRENLSGDFPLNFLQDNLDHNETYYNITYETHQKFKLKTDNFINCLLQYLKTNEEISNRPIFLKQFYHVKYLLQISPASIEHDVFSSNSTYNIIAWLLERSDELDFDALKTKFIYFPPQWQKKILRKLFFYVKTGKLQLGIEELNEITRIDAEIFKLNEQENSHVTLDFTTDLVLKALLNFKKENRFFVENELLQLLLTNLYDKENKITISDLFEECRGIQLGEYKIDYSSNKIINKIFTDIESYYYEISFDYNATLVDEVKKIPGRKWNKDELRWQVSKESEIELLEFATRFRFIISVTNEDDYSNNKHLAKFYRKDIPSGVKFCEGRKSKELDRRFQKEFWWCRNQICYQNCETTHDEEWRKYNFIDFCNILNLDLTEVNRMGDVIPNGYYYQFTTLLNRFKILLEKLYCKSCDEILQPVGTGHFGAYTVTKFHCKNSACKACNEVIYLNHCLNGQCNNVIDSRISKKCSHGLYICDACGSCCSHGMFSRRLDNLKNNGGYIHTQLVNYVSGKLGHLERAEYFCHKCGESMVERSYDMFHCLSCQNVYDTSKFKFKREHRPDKKV